MTRITIFNEFRHERTDEKVRAIYPDGIHVALRDGIEARLAGSGEALSFRYALQDEPEHGLSQEVLEDTDTLLWWAHMGHGDISDEVAARVQQAVLSGMGLLVLHSAHFSKPFQRLLGSNCSLHWREADDSERLWNLEPAHPIMAGVPDHIELDREEMYGERFDVPKPDELLMISWFSGGEVFRSLCTWQRGHGRVVYFRPGHETYPTYHDTNIQQIIANASLWAARRITRPTVDAPNSPRSPESLKGR